MTKLQIKCQINPFSMYDLFACNTHSQLERCCNDGGYSWRCKCVLSLSGRATAGGWLVVRDIVEDRAGRGRCGVLGMVVLAVV